MITRNELAGFLGKPPETSTRQSAATGNPQTYGPPPVGLRVAGPGIGGNNPRHAEAAPHPPLRPEPPVILGAATVLGLALRCAPSVAPATLLALARVESGLDPLALGVNGAQASALRPRSLAEAVERAKALLAAGANLDLGLAQINSGNLARLGLTVETAFDPCRSLAAGAALLHEAYASARLSAADPQSALRTALSVYNTGDQARGFRNGYVTRVVAAAAGLEARVPAPPPRPPAASSPAWDAFGDLGAAALVTASPSAQGAAP
jgi:type IV secretion system protein VirB1